MARRRRIITLPPTPPPPPQKPWWKSIYFFIAGPLSVFLGLVFYAIGLKECNKTQHQKLKENNYVRGFLIPSYLGDTSDH